MNKELEMNPNQLVAFIGKPCAEFTKADIIHYIQENGIRMVNFMYPAGDGRLKTLNFVINNLGYLDAILTCGERVDGSSLFPFIEAGSSDLYVIPKKSSSICFSFLPKLKILQSQNHFSLRFSSSVFSSFSCIPSVSPPDLPLFKNAVTDRLIQMFFGNLFFLLHIRNSTGYLQNLMTRSCRKIHFLISIP